MIVLTLYSRPGCHLCDEMKAVVKSAAKGVAASQSTPIRIDEVDISTDAALEALYGLEIPVLMIDGRKAAKYRITEEALTRLLKAGEAGGAG